MTVRSCFAGLAAGLHSQLARGSESRNLFEYHRGRIAAIFATQPDLPLHQDTVAGFLHGFLTVGMHYVPEHTVEQQSMFPVLGGALLLGKDLPIDASPAATAVSSEFFDRAVAALDDPAPVGGSLNMVRHAFVIAGDVPMTCASLAGFCLGVLYAGPYLPEFNADPSPLIAAACYLARDLTYDP